MTSNLAGSSAFAVTTILISLPLVPEYLAVTVIPATVPVALTPLVTRPTNTVEAPFNASPNRKLLPSP